jgi:hypothetical protein
MSHLSFKIRFLFFAIFIVASTTVVFTILNNLKVNEKKLIKQKSTDDTNFLNKTWTELFEGKSTEQLITLVKTLEFMIKNVDEYDPELIQFVKSLIKKPSKQVKQLNLKKTKLKNNDYSQFGQSIYLSDRLLMNRTNGFFIESGAYDGEELSNTLYFELNFNWTGLLIEPIPFLYEKLLAKNRNVFALNACIAKEKPILAKFRVFHALSGREDQMGQIHRNIIDQGVPGLDEKYKIEYMPCFSINTIMRALDLKNVDFFSLDIEGGEWDVVNSIRLDHLNIKSFCIEWTANENNKDSIIKHLVKNGYNLVKSTDFDLFFFKN